MTYSDIRTACDGLFKSYCYEEAMKNEITKRNRDLIINLIKKAEKQHVLENPEKNYTFSDIDRKHDNISGREFTDFNDRIRLNFEADFNYPADYKYKTERSFSFTSADFTLMKDGTVNNINVKAKFQNPDNERFKAYFENEVYKFIK